VAARVKCGKQLHRIVTEGETKEKKLEEETTAVAWKIEAI
jgi:hypothetical protein